MQKFWIKIFTILFSINSMGANLYSDYSMKQQSKDDSDLGTKHQGIDIDTESLADKETVASENDPGQAEYYNLDNQSFSFDIDKDEDYYEQTLEPGDSAISKLLYSLKKLPKDELRQKVTKLIEEIESYKKQSDDIKNQQENLEKKKQELQDRKKKLEDDMQKVDFNQSKMQVLQESINSLNNDEDVKDSQDLKNASEQIRSINLDDLKDQTIDDLNALKTNLSPLSDNYDDKLLGGKMRDQNNIKDILDNLDKIIEIKQKQSAVDQQIIENAKKINDLSKDISNLEGKTQARDEQINAKNNDADEIQSQIGADEYNLNQMQEDNKEKIEKNQKAIVGLANKLNEQQITFLNLSNKEEYLKQYESIRNQLQKHINDYNNKMTDAIQAVNNFNEKIAQNLLGLLATEPAVLNGGNNDDPKTQISNAINEITGIQEKVKALKNTNDSDGQIRDGWPEELKDEIDKIADKMQTKDLEEILKKIKEIKDLDDKIKEQEKVINDFKKEKGIKTQAKENKEKDINNFENQKEQIEKDLKQQEKDIADEQEKLKNAQNEIAGITNEIAKLKEKEKLHKDINEKVVGFIRLAGGFNNGLDPYNNALSNPDKFENNFEDTKKKIEEVLENAKGIKDEIKEIQGADEGQKNTVIAEMNKFIKAVEDNLEKIKNHKEKIDKYKANKKIIADLEDQHKKLADENKKKQDQIGGNNKKMADLKNKMEELNSIEGLNDIQNKIEDFQTDAGENIKGLKDKIKAYNDNRDNTKIPQMLSDAQIIKQGLTEIQKSIEEVEYNNIAKGDDAKEYQKEIDDWKQKILQSVDQNLTEITKIINGLNQEQEKVDQYKKDVAEYNKKINEQNQQKKDIDNKKSALETQSKAQQENIINKIIQHEIATKKYKMQKEQYDIYNIIYSVNQEIEDVNKKITETKYGTARYAPVGDLADQLNALGISIDNKVKELQSGSGSGVNDLQNEIQAAVQQSLRKINSDTGIIDVLSNQKTIIDKAQNEIINIQKANDNERNVIKGKLLVVKNHVGEKQEEVTKANEIQNILFNVWTAIDQINQINQIDKINLNINLGKWDKRFQPALLHLKYLLSQKIKSLFPIITSGKSFANLYQEQKSQDLSGWINRARQEIENYNSLKTTIDKWNNAVNYKREEGLARKVMQNEYNAGKSLTALNSIRKENNQFHGKTIMVQDGENKKIIQGYNGNYVNKAAAKQTKDALDAIAPSIYLNFVNDQLFNNAKFNIRIKSESDAKKYRAVMSKLYERINPQKLEVAQVQKFLSQGGRTVLKSLIQTGDFFQDYYNGLFIGKYSVWEKFKEKIQNEQNPIYASDVILIAAIAKMHSVKLMSNELEEYKVEQQVLNGILKKDYKEIGDELFDTIVKYAINNKDNGQVYKGAYIKASAEVEKINGNMRYKPKRGSAELVFKLPQYVNQDDVIEAKLYHHNVNKDGAGAKKNRGYRHNNKTLKNSSFYRYYSLSDLAQLFSMSHPIRNLIDNLQPNPANENLIFVKDQVKSRFSTNDSNSAPIRGIFFTLALTQAVKPQEAEGGQYTYNPDDLEEAKKYIDSVIKSFNVNLPKINFGNVSEKPPQGFNLDQIKLIPDQGDAPSKPIEPKPLNIKDDIDQFNQNQDQIQELEDQKNNLKEIKKPDEIQFKEINNLRDYKVFELQKKDVTDEIKNNQKNQKDLNEKNQNLQKDIEKNNRQIADNNKEQDKINDENKNIKNYLANNKLQDANYNAAKMNDLSNEINKKEKELQNKITEKESIEENIKDLESSIKENRKNLSEIESKLEQAKDELDEINKEMKALEKGIIEEQNKLNDLKNKSKEIENAIRNINYQKSDASNIEDRSAELKELKEQQAKLQESIKENQKAVNQKEKDLNEFKEKAKNQEKELRQKIEQNKANLENLQNDIKNMENQQDQDKQALEAKKEELQKAQEENNELNKEKREMEMEENELIKKAQQNQIEAIAQLANKLKEEGKKAKEKIIEREKLQKELEAEKENEARKKDLQNKIEQNEKNNLQKQQEEVKLKNYDKKQNQKVHKQDDGKAIQNILVDSNINQNAAQNITREMQIKPIGSDELFENKFRDDIAKKENVFNLDQGNQFFKKMKDNGYEGQYLNKHQINNLLTNDSNKVMLMFGPTGTGKTAAFDALKKAAEKNGGNETGWQNPVLVELNSATLTGTGSSGMNFMAEISTQLSLRDNIKDEKIVIFFDEFDKVLLTFINADGGRETLIEEIKTMLEESKKGGHFKFTPPENFDPEKSPDVALKNYNIMGDDVKAYLSILNMDKRITPELVLYLAGENDISELQSEINVIREMIKNRFDLIFQPITIPYKDIKFIFAGAMNAYQPYIQKILQDAYKKINNKYIILSEIKNNMSRFLNAMVDITNKDRIGAFMEQIDIVSLLRYPTKEDYKSILNSVSKSYDEIFEKTLNTNIIMGETYLDFVSNKAVQSKSNTRALFLETSKTINEMILNEQFDKNKTVTLKVEKGEEQNTLYKSGEANVIMQIESNGIGGGILYKGSIMPKAVIDNLNQEYEGEGNTKKMLTAMMFLNVLKQLYKKEHEADNKVKMSHAFLLNDSDNSNAREIIKYIAKEFGANVLEGLDFTRVSPTGYEGDSANEVIEKNLGGNGSDGLLVQEILGYENIFGSGEKMSFKMPVNNELLVSVEKHPGMIILYKRDDEIKSLHHIDDDKIAKDPIGNSETLAEHLANRMGVPQEFIARFGAILWDALVSEDEIESKADTMEKILSYIGIINKAKRAEKEKYFNNLTGGDKDYLDKILQVEKENYNMRKKFGEQKEKQNETTIEDILEGIDKIIQSYQDYEAIIEKGRKLTDERTNKINGIQSDLKNQYIFMKKEGIIKEIEKYTTGIKEATDNNTLMEAMYKAVAFIKFAKHHIDIYQDNKNVLDDQGIGIYSKIEEFNETLHDVIKKRIKERNDIDFMMSIDIILRIMHNTGKNDGIIEQNQNFINQYLANNLKKGGMITYDFGTEKTKPIIVKMPGPKRKISGANYDYKIGLRSKDKLDVSIPPPPESGMIG